MTRASAVSRQPYTGTGALATYTYPFFTQLETDILITKEIIATGVQSTLVLTTDYTVLASGLANPNGGSITLVAGNLPATEKIVIRRVVPLTQITDIRNQAAYFPETQEDEYDKRNDIDQQQQDEIDRCLIFAETTNASTFDTTVPVPVANQAIRINSANDGLELFTVVDGSNISLPAGLEIMVQTAAGVLTARTLSATGNITIDNGTGASGNPTVNSSAIDTEIDLIINSSTISRGTWSCTNAAQVVIDNGFRFRGVDTDTIFTFSSSRTFDITGTGGDLGALNTGSEANSTWYYLIALGDTTGVTAPHIIGVTQSNYTSFTTADLTGNYAVYDDYKRIGGVFNNSSGNFIFHRFVEGRVIFDNPTADTTFSFSDTSYADRDISTFAPPVARIATMHFNVSAQTINYRPNGSSGSGFNVNSAGSDTAITDVYLDTSQIFDLKVTGGTASGYVIGYNDDLMTEDNG